MNAPDKTTEIKAAITGLLACGTTIFGWVGWILIVWLCSMLLDYITGTAAAMSTGTWNSSIARKGLWHKLGTIFAILVACLCDIAIAVIIEQFGSAPFEYGGFITPIVALWYTFTELGSITENAAKLGAPIPKFLIKIIEKAKDATEAAGNDKAGE